MTGIARSRNGNLFGPWEHFDQPLFDHDGGHAMLFQSLNGAVLLTLHQLNNCPMERTILIPVEITNCGLVISCETEQ